MEFHIEIDWDAEHDYESIPARMIGKVNNTAFSRTDVHFGCIWCKPRPPN